MGLKGARHPSASVSRRREVLWGSGEGEAGWPARGRQAQRSARGRQESRKREEMAAREAEGEGKGRGDGSRHRHQQERQASAFVGRIVPVKYLPRRAHDGAGRLHARALRPSSALGLPDRGLGVLWMAGVAAQLADVPRRRDELHQRQQHNRQAKVRRAASGQDRGAGEEHGVAAGMPARNGRAAGASDERGRRAVGGRGACRRF